MNAPLEESATKRSRLEDGAEVVTATDRTTRDDAAASTEDAAAPSAAAAPAPVDEDGVVDLSHHRPAVPAMTFPYPLDTFQQRSVDILEAGESVLVSAHTSAGKTTVALYAIAKALREKKRVIYTSPIKALSNQKFREFSEKYDSVGLMTGDTTIKPDSDCLVMTTEILRSMLYRGTEMLREVGCVVFDEVHYMRDKSRGVVWEETIVMLPEGCQYVFLSATIPNAREFADWVEHVHPKTKCHVVHTDFRPTPLQHFLYPQGAEGIFLTVDDKSQFREDNFRRAMVALGPDQQNSTETMQGAAGAGGPPKPKGKKAGGQKSTQPIMSIIRLVMDREMYPVITFCFAKAECERNALALGAMNFNNDEESALVTEVFNNAIESLSEDDRRLPAIEHLLPLLRHGVGIHHSGLLPILKEVVEVLFQAGLVKVLFSTETFSMGLNMPARTVVFASVKKWDGEKQRYLTGGEYIQMSGRAGRRGLDRFGVVIAMVNEAVEPDRLRTMMIGGADTLNSSFHLTYNMVLNLLRVEDVDPEFMMVRSFSQFQRERNRPQLEAKVAKLEAEIATITLENEDALEEFVACEEQLSKLTSEERSIKCRPSVLKPFLKPGRIVKLVRASDSVSFGWGLCVSVAPIDGNDRAAQDDATNWSVDCAVVCMKPEAAKPSQEARHFTPCHVTDYTSDKAELSVLSFVMTDVSIASRFCVKLPAAGLYDEVGKVEALKILSKLWKQHQDAVPTLTSEEMNLSAVPDAEAKHSAEVLATAESYGKLQDKMVRLRRRLEQNELRSNPTPELLAEFERFKEKMVLEAQLEEARVALKQVQKTVLKEELKQMMRVLRRMDYIDRDNLILRKGRVACEITSEDESEILLTELLFKGILNEMPVEMIVALMSCLVNVNKTPDGFSLPDEFQQPLAQLKDVVSRIAAVSMESGLLQNAGDQNSSQNASGDKVKPSLMEVTYKWAQGHKFIDLVGMTSAYEGDIVRMMRRLEELLRQLAGAAKSPAIGSVELHDKFMSGIQLIKRDIVFASSLYL